MKHPHTRLERITLKKVTQGTNRLKGHRNKVRRYEIDWWGTFHDRIRRDFILGLRRKLRP